MPIFICVQTALFLFFKCLVFLICGIVLSAIPKHDGKNTTDLLQFENEGFAHLYFILFENALIL